MNPMQAVRFVNLTPPAIKVDNATFTVAELDTVVNGVKYDYCTILFIFGDIDIAMTALKLTESDTSGSGHADVTGAVGGTDFTLPTAADADNDIGAMYIDLRKRKRYLDVTATIGDGSTGGYLTIIAILSNGKEDPSTSAKRNTLFEVTI